MGLLNAVRTRGLTWVTVHALLFLLDKYVELVLFPKSIASFGLAGGIAAMTALSFLICWGLLWLYDRIPMVARWMDNGVRRKFLLALCDAMGYETIKEAGGEFRKLVFSRATPISNRSMRVETGHPLFDIPLGIWELLRRWLLAPLVNLLLLLVWEPLRWLLVAPFVRFLFQPSLFLYLSLWHDPMTCVIFMRPVNYHWMGKREWMIFISSVIVSCLGFGLLVGWLMELAQIYAPWLYEWYMWFVERLT